MGLPRGGAVDPYAAATLVVFNKADPDSGDLARFYAEKRGIPKEQIIGLQCAVAEQISRAEYDLHIAEPLRRALSTNFLWTLREPDHPLGPVESNKIRFIALIRGIPLKIGAAPGYPGDQPSGPPEIASRNEAAVDSELATLGMFLRVISGAAKNPIYRGHTRIADAPFPGLMLVCRLDGPTPAMVRQMILDSIATEEQGLRGFTYVDARGIGEGAYVEGDKWLLSAANKARQLGSPVILDNGPELFPKGYPMRQAAIYLGWYAQDVAGPFTQPNFRFNRGAIAVHIHSFSASTVRNPAGAWVGPLIAAGAAATLGNVEEPYLVFTPHLDLFHERLRAGYTFAESAYMSQNVLSWMNTFVGDPLYRPFRSVQELNEQPASGEWAEYRKGARLWTSKGKGPAVAALQASGKKLRSGIIMEGLGLLQTSAGDGGAALGSFAQARQFYKQPEDVHRVAIHEIFQLRAGNKNAEASAHARKMIALAPEAPSAEVLRMLDPLAPPPPPPPAAAAPR